MILLIILHRISQGTIRKDSTIHYGNLNLSAYIDYKHKFILYEFTVVNNLVIRKEKG